MQSRFDDAVLVALGGNLKGDYASCQRLLEAALDQFAAAGLTLLRRSSWWRSAAWPDPLEPDYINGLALVETTLGPGETLTALHTIEARFGRFRDRPNAPRTLDLDLIAHGRTVLQGDPLVLPHPRAAERLFVMGPLAEIAPDWRHPVLGETAKALAARASVGRDSAPV
ncbi:MAG TPA: 2-amino-4-hydroxy-6-hydroxymethyldihydropteridine diphosphokinase [Caulobacteraceae bacterium]|jgi:2-amino-4-hydroxy-6-hydroxymethyldihydropteridine diphosphokinase